MRVNLLVICWFLINLSASAEEAKPAYAPIEDYQQETIEGFTVLIHPEVLKHKTEAQQMRKELTSQLQKMKQVVPAKPLSALTKVRIWVEWQQRKRGAAEFHVSKNWLKNNGYNPVKAGNIELGNTRNFVKWSRTTQPWMVLHEFAHAYHHLVLGANHKEINQAYKAAVAKKNYESVDFITGGKRKAYALTNDKEYFAEISEAYFGKNDFFPFNASELAKHDPQGYKVLTRCWGQPLQENAE